LQASPQPNSPHAKIDSKLANFAKTQNDVTLTLREIPAFCKHLPHPKKSRKPKPCLDLHLIPQPANPQQTQMLANYSTRISIHALSGG